MASMVFAMYSMCRRNPMVVLAGMMCFAPIRPGHSPHTDASARRRRGRTRPVNPQACRKVYAVLDLLRERFTVEWDPESKGYRKAIRRPR